MPGTPIQSLNTHREAHAVIILTLIKLTMIKLKLREGKLCAQGHSASKWYH